MIPEIESIKIFCVGKILSVVIFLAKTNSSLILAQKSSFIFDVQYLFNNFFEGEKNEFH